MGPATGFPSIPAVGSGGGGAVTSVTASPDLKITGPASMPNVETLFAQPLSGQLYCNFSVPNGGIGSKLSPFNKPSDVMAIVNASPLGSVWGIEWVGGLTPNGHVGDAFDWPVGRTGIFTGQARTFPTLGAVRMLGRDGLVTAILVRDMSVSQFILQDAPGIVTSGIIIAVGENATIEAGGVVQRDEFGAPGGISLTGVQWAGLNNAGIEGGATFTTSAIYGPIGCTLCTADNTRFTNPVATARLDLTQCSLEGSLLVLADKGPHTIKGCYFKDPPFEIQANAGGQVATVKMDLESWYHWLEADGFTSAVAPGDGVNVYQHQFATNCEFEVFPSFVNDRGKVYRQSPTTPGVVVLAQGDSAGNATAMVGIWQGDEDSVNPFSSPTGWVRLAAGLTLLGADPLYLDPVTPGCATNVPNAFPLSVCIRDSMGYAGVEAVCVFAASAAPSLGQSGLVMPLVGPMAPPPSDDTDLAALSLADIDTRFNVAGLMTISGTVPERGDSWTSAGDLRWRIVNGSLMMQVSDDGVSYRVLERAMINGSAPGSVLFVGSIDGSDTVNPGGNGAVLVWSQTSAGTVDVNNQIVLGIAQDVGGLFNVSMVAIEGGIPTALVNDTYASEAPDINAIAIAMDAGNLTGWAGSSPSSMRRLTPAYATLLAPDRQALLIGTNGSPNTTFKATALRWQPYPTY